MNVKISVVTIVKDDKDYIAETMYSVINQTYKNIEYIIKDSCSSDGTTQIISDIKAQYHAININHINKKDTGIYDGMNQAVSECHGDWIIFINSGDLFADNYVLEHIFSTDSKYDNYGVLYGEAIIVNNGEEKLWKGNINTIKKRMPFAHESCFVRTQILKENKFDTSYNIASDYSLILDLYNKNISFKKLNLKIVIFNLNGISSSKYVQRYKEREKIKEQHGYKTNALKYSIGLIAEYTKVIFDTLIPDFILKKIKTLYLHFKYSNLISK